MKRLLNLIFMLIPFFLYSMTLYLATGDGEIAYSQDRGQTWLWKTAYLPMTPVADITSDANGNLYYVSKTGEVYESTDEGGTWTSIQNLSMSDAVAIWVDGGGTIYVLGEGGDVYSNSGGWSLKLNAGLSDFVDLIPNISSGLLGITSSGDVVSIDGASASIIGNIGASNIVGGAVKDDTIYVITYEGDIARSTDGVTYNFIGTLSQVGTVSLVAAKSGSLYVTTEGGEVAQSLGGVTWAFKGSANQMYIAGITSDTIAALSVEQLFFNLSANEDGILIRLFGRANKWDIYKSKGESDFQFLTEVKNSNTYIDKDVKPVMRYGYKLKANGEWIGTLWIVFPVRFSERILRVYPNPSGGKFNLSLHIRKEGEKEIFISDIAGRKEMLFKGYIPKGTQKLRFNIENKKGVYFIIFEGNREKIVLY